MSKTNIKKASSADYDIIPRRVKFDWETSPLHWIPDDPFASHALNEFSFLLTQGEKFFCRVFRTALPHVTDDKLRADVEAFIKQEAVHSRAHHDSIEEYLKRLGLSGGRFEERNALLFDQLLLDDPFGRKLPETLQYQWLVFRIGLVAAIEHYTAALGVFVLEADAWDQHGADPVVADLFRWHGAEEVEHRTVAYDLYRHLGGTHSMRTLAMAIAFPALVSLSMLGTAHMIRHDEKLKNASSAPIPLRLALGWLRSARLGTFPTMGWFPMHALRFLRPGYNPLDEASTEQALAYIHSSPGVLAANNGVQHEPA